MHVLILEGIATSGKSSIIRELEADLSTHMSVVVADESVTHIPIMHKRDDAHLDFFKELVGGYLSKSADVAIFDRLYLTQAYRAKCGVDVYEPVEELLLAHHPLTVFLQVDEAAIAERVKKATEHRDPKWKEYVQSWGESIDEIAQYYIEQQQSQLELLTQSAIPYKIFNTTSHDYSNISHEIVDYCAGLS